MQINKIRKEKGEITIDTAEIQRIIRDYYKQLQQGKIKQQKKEKKIKVWGNKPKGEITNKV